MLTRANTPHILSIDPDIRLWRVYSYIHERRTQYRAHISRNKTWYFSAYSLIAPDDPPFNAPTVVVERPVMATNVNKNFDSVDKLANNAGNYRIWIARIKGAIKASRGRALITAAPDAESMTLNDEIVNAICGKLPNSIYTKVMHLDNTHELLAALDRDYNIVTHTVEAVTEAQLYTLKCTNDRDINGHLDKMLEVRDKIAEFGRQITNETFINAISASIPEAYRDIIAITKQSINQSNQSTGTQINALRAALALVPDFPEANLPAFEPRFLTSTEVINALRQKAASKAAVSGTTRKHDRQEKEKEEQANWVKGKGGKKDWGKGKGKKGWGKGKRNDDSKGKSEDRKCYNCQGYGHYSKQCPSPKRKQKDSANEARGEGSKPAEKAQTAKIEEVIATAMPADAWMATTPETVFAIDVFDTGATIHVTPDQNRLYNVKKTEPFAIRTANGNYVHTTIKGDMDIKVPHGNRFNTIKISDVRCNPSFTSMLISPNKLDEKRHTLLFEDGKLFIRDPKKKLIGIIAKRNGVYAANWANMATTDDANTWPMLSLYDLHVRLGHVNYAYIKKMASSGKLKGLRLDPNHQEERSCVSCAVSKIRRTIVPPQRTSPTAPKYGDHVHMDIWGPAKVQTPSHGRYALTIVNDATRWCHMFVMPNKSDALSQYVKFQTWLQTQYGITVKVLQSDNDGAFLSKDFDEYLAKNGTDRRLTVHDTPAHNGVAERVHGTIFQIVRTNLASARLPTNLWGEALTYALYVYNRTPHSGLQFRSPFEARYGTPPDLTSIYPFGQQCVVRLESADKLTERGVQCRWLAPDEPSNGYRVYWPSRKVSTERNIRMIFGVEEENSNNPPEPYQLIIL